MLARVCSLLRLVFKLPAFNLEFDESSSDKVGRQFRWPKIGRDAYLQFSDELRIPSFTKASAGYTDLP